MRDKLSAPLSTRILAGLLGDVLVATKRLRELLAAALPPTPGGGAPAAAAGGDDAALVKLLKLVLDPIEQQVCVALWCWSVPSVQSNAQSGNSPTHALSSTARGKVACWHGQAHAPNLLYSCSMSE